MTEKTNEAKIAKTKARPKYKAVAASMNDKRQAGPSHL
jgi:hypothetical protein